MKTEQERRLASVYIGAVGSEIEVGECVDSIRNLNIRRGDSPPRIIRATKGYEARQNHINEFRKSNHGAILLLDADMKFEPDTLERLRSHGLPYVSGYYMRRMYQPVLPVMYEKCPPDVWPMSPVTRHIQEMDVIGANGWGCVLIHREVFEAVDPILKGEDEVIEDDMDVWPYDLDKMVRAINQLDKLTSKPKTLLADRKKIRHLASFLKSEFRPLRGTKDVVGSDIRFPYFAAVAGYDLYLDPNVGPGHSVNYMLAPSDYADVETKNATVKKELADRIANMRNKYEERMRELR